jgi:hypothetical protein
MIKLINRPGPFPPNAIKRLRTHFRHVRVQYEYLKDKKTGKTFPRERSVNGVSPYPPRQIEFDEEDPVRGTKKKTNVEKFFLESMIIH